MKSTARATSDSTTGRSLPVRMRADLVCSQQTFQGGDYWIIKDPLSLRYYRFQEEEYSLLQALDGQRSAEQIQQEFQQNFAPQKISMGEIHQFVGMLYRSSLILSNAPDQGKSLYSRYQKQNRSEAWGKLSNLLSYRFPGFDPGRMLDRLAPWTDWCFTKVAATCFLLVGLAALTLVFTHFEELQSRLPSFQQFFAARNWLWLAVALAVTKIIHELGHGLACRRFGGECHEMGVMLLVMTPCLYCNVSDAWTIPSKWKRIFISAAGMYVELILAAFAVLIWWFSQPGIVHYLALNVVFVSGVSTLLFNLNPLLRYDGYYILADLLEIPNLRQKSTKLLERAVGQWMLGTPPAPDPFIPKHHVWLFITYSIAAFVYRWLLTFTIFWFLYQLLEPYGLKILGQMLALFSIYGLVIAPFSRMSKFFSVPGRSDAVKPSRLLISGAIGLLLIAGILFIRLPHYVDMPLYLQPAGLNSVYVEVPGSVQQVTASANQFVQAGQPIARLVNYELNEKLSIAEGEYLQRSQIVEDVYQLRAADDVEAQFAKQTAEVQKDNSLAVLEDYRKRAKKLEICAPVAGWIVAAQEQKEPGPDADRLPSLVGDPLATKNRLCLLPEQTLVCQIAPDLQQWEAIILVDQQDVEFMLEGQTAKIWLAQFPGRVFHSSLHEVAVDPVRFVPPQMASQNAGPIESTPSLAGKFKPDSAKYLVIAKLEDSQQMFVKDGTGVARIHVGYQTLGNRLWRAIAHTFNFKM